MTRHSLIFTAPKTIAIVKETLPQLQAKEVLVKAEVSAISAGTELLIYRGEAPDELPADETIASLRNGTLRFPLKYGYAVVGRVNNIGASVDPSWLGRRVFVFHPHESHFVAQINELHPVPENISTDRPSYSFKTSKSGTLNFNGKCRGNVDKAVAGINHISLLISEPGNYNDCKMTITDSSNNKSRTQKLSPFVVVGEQ